MESPPPGQWHARIVAALTAYHDGALAPAQMREIAAHVADCAWCQARLAAFAQLDARLLAAPTPAPPPTLRRGMARRIAAASPARARHLWPPQPPKEQSPMATNAPPEPRAAGLASYIMAALITLLIVALSFGVFHSRLVNVPPAHGGNPITLPTRGNGTCPDEYVHPPITHAMALSDLALVTPDEGWAVGGDNGFGQGGTQSTMLHLSGGQWMPNADLASAASIQSIAMTSASDGWLVYTTPHQTEQTTSNTLFHLARYNGQHWLPAAVDLSLYGDTNIFALTLHMFSATDGWLVPFQLQTQGHAALLHYDGSAWQRIETPFVSTSATFYQFFASASTGPNELWLAGNYTDDTTNGGQYAVAAHYLNGQWSVDAGVRAQSGSLQHIAMLSPTDGWAYGQGGGKNINRLYHYDGHQWLASALPSWLSANVGLEAMAAGPDAALWVVARFPTAFVYGEERILHLQGGQWQTVAANIYPTHDPLLNFTVSKIIPFSTSDVYLLGNIRYQKSCPPFATFELSRGVIWQAIGDGHAVVVTEMGE